LTTVIKPHGGAVVLSADLANNACCDPLSSIDEWEVGGAVM